MIYEIWRDISALRTHFATSDVQRFVAESAPFEAGDIALGSGLAEAPSAPTDVILGHNVASQAEVDEVMEQARRAGARIVKPARKTFWGGYAGFIQDRDDHMWEIAFDPGFMPPD